MQDCPFCHLQPERVFYETPEVACLWDAFPVSEGHALIVPKRHIASWFDATAAEKSSIAEATEVVRQEVVRRYGTENFNIGINVGAAAGQTVFHLHVHVIPRRPGDVQNPRGGVRGVIPSKRDYTQPSLIGFGTSKPIGKLIHGWPDNHFINSLVEHLSHSTQVDIAVAFTLMSGITLLFDHLKAVLEKGGKIRYLTGDYRDCTEPEALFKLLDLKGDINRRLFVTGKSGKSLVTAFHPKAYILVRNDDTGVAFVGSSNVSKTALSHGVEWNYGISSETDRAGFDEIRKKFDELFRSQQTADLTPEWIQAYSERRQIPTGPRFVEPEEIEPEEPLRFEPHEIQMEALAALQATRANGNRAGLVVLATGLGKTWLSAFDSLNFIGKRVLFVAHREEILEQARDTFRKVHPFASLGLYSGRIQEPDAQMVFASIQTLGKQHHLERFRRTDFEYIIVDEFHHASADTYRRLIEYFEPSFLLGLTATPERTDGGNLLALCNENLVYRADLREGITRGLLAPFHYFGIPDETDYTNIPWRGNKFSEEELTNAVATQARAENALQQLEKHGGSKTFAFCVSTRHADFMAKFFQENGKRAVAVHSGEGSASRPLSLEKLKSGELDIVCTVDMFNEGVDVPELDTVLMLRPTESKILWLQQFGRGLRKSEGKDRLRVIDYIGNHRSFLLKPQALFDLTSGRVEMRHFIEEFRSGNLHLPPGCEVTYELGAIEILRKLSAPADSQLETLRRYYQDFKYLTGNRPLAVETFHDGYDPKFVKPQFSSWLEFVDSMGDLNPNDREAMNANIDFLQSLETTPMTRSYKFILLMALLNKQAIPGGLGIQEIMEEVRKIVSKSSALQSDFGEALSDDQQLKRLLETNPINAWVGGRGTRGQKYFEYTDGFLSSALICEERLIPLFQNQVREIAEWRLADYLGRNANGNPDDIEFNIVTYSGRPSLIAKDTPLLKEVLGTNIEVFANGRTYKVDFAKTLITNIYRDDDATNALPALLRGWFGADAGLPGTAHFAVMTSSDEGWQLSPKVENELKLRLWQSYSREQIPGLFQLEFSTAIWNVGYVRRDGHIFLLVTLEKEDHQESFKYEDAFLDASTFVWKCQNRTSRNSKDGKAIRNHIAEETLVHLFVRATKKIGNRAAPFVFCGDVTFQDWDGDRPISVKWHLPEPVPERLWKGFRVPKVELKQNSD